MSPLTTSAELQLNIVTHIGAVRLDSTILRWTHSCRLGRGRAGGSRNGHSIRRSSHSRTKTVHPLVQIALHLRRERHSVSPPRMRARMYGDVFIPAALARSYDARFRRGGPSGARDSTASNQENRFSWPSSFRVGLSGSRTRRRSRSCSSISARYGEGGNSRSFPRHRRFFARHRQSFVLARVTPT